MTRAPQCFRRFQIAGALLLLTGSSAIAGNAALQSACFPPSALSAVAGEEAAQKGNRSFDRPEKLGDFKPAAGVAPELRGAIRRVDIPGGQKAVALTFDLCEQRGEIAGYEGRIIDYLRQQGVKATFFTGGKWMVSHQTRIQQLMLDPLFEIGNHTETHQNLRLVTPAIARQQILAPQKTYEDTRARLAANQCLSTIPSALESIPQQPRVFRFPYGACNDATMKDVNDAGMLAIQWDVATGDPDPHVSAAAIANAMVHQTKPGSIIVNHANGRGWHTAEALPIAIPQLKAKGYTFVTVSELIAMGKPVITRECYDRKPGDTNRYDFLSALHHPLNGAGAADKATKGWSAATTVKKPQARVKPATTAKATRGSN